MNSILTVTSAATVSRLALEADLRAELGNPSEPAASWVGKVLDQASVAVAGFCRRTFGRETLSEQFRLEGAASSLVLSGYPVASLTSVTEDAIALLDAQREVDPVRGLLYRLQDDERRPWTARKVVVVYVAGYLLPGEDGANLPEDITRATLITATAMFHAAGRDALIRSENTDGVASVSYLDPRTGNGGLPQAAADLLASYREIRV